ncbi:LysR substrate-binding domain-containing protein [Ensifer sp. 4252]|uniref:LysR substrate-binding domain-containing protein n=1 Tax=Ensifer sp. 4252 TaxID=3373915 RepID=UPI003D2459E5
MDHLLALRTFVRIAEAGSFAKAADTLNLPRSTVSKLMQDLEAHLGSKLLERTTRTLTVTIEGAAYHERALRLLAELDDMDNAVASARFALKGRLRVDIGSSLANLILVPALREFQKLYPELELVVGVSDRPVDLVGEGVDCVIRGGALSDTSLIARRLCELDYVTCAAPSYLSDKQAPNTPHEMEADHRIVSYFSALSGKLVPMRFFRDGEHVEFFGRSGVALNESTAHLKSILSGLGIGQTFGFMARPHLETGDLVELLPDWTQPHHTLSLVYPASRYPSVKLRVFSDWVALLFGQYDMRGR